MHNQLLVESINMLCNNERYELQNSESLRNITAVSQDSRKIKENDIYVAIKGEQHDGHDFIGSALDNGASLIISEKELQINRPYLRCDDSIKCIQDLAKIYRKAHLAQFIGLTGTNGKTSTKEMMASVFSESFNVASTIGNYNNHIGLPLSLLNLKEDIEIAIMEIGTNHPGEIKFLTEILDPDYALITNIGYGHIGNFESIEELVEEKTDLFRYSKQSCKLFINQDDRYLKSYKDQHPYVYFSFQNDIIDPRSNNIGQYSFQLENEVIKLNLLGKHQLQNAAAVLAVVKCLGLTTSQIKKGFEKARAVQGRMEGILIDPLYIINDAYNANPSSMRKALDYLVDLKNKNKVAILGDMGELGDSELQFHQDIIDDYEKTDIREFILYGDIFSKVESEKSKHINNLNEIVNYCKKSYTDATILIKSSNSTGLQKLVKLFKEMRN